MTDTATLSREKLAGYIPEIIYGGVALVVGAGALGQNLLMDLALAGIGEIRIVDFDEFEDHNRTRSPLYPTPEEAMKLGLSKSKTAGHKLRALMTAPAPIVRFAQAPVQALGDGAFYDVKAVIACVDNPRGRSYLADKCRWLGLPLIEAGFNGEELTLSCYPATRGDDAQTAPCWRCSHPDEEGVFSCSLYAVRAEVGGVIPAIQNTAATLAGLQAEAAILALHGHMPLAARRLFLNLRNGGTRTVVLSTDPQCPGVHHVLEGDLDMLNTPAFATMSELLVEVSARLDAPTSLALPAPWIEYIPCTVCGESASVRRPKWAWLMNPRRVECGGVFSRAPRLNCFPKVEVEISSLSDTEILALSAVEVGLPPLSVVEAHAANRSPHFFRLPGSVTDLFETVD